MIKVGLLNLVGKGSIEMIESVKKLDGGEEEGGVKGKRGEIKSDLILLLVKLLELYKLGLGDLPGVGNCKFKSFKESQESLSKLELEVEVVIIEVGEYSNG